MMTWGLLAGALMFVWSPVSFSVLRFLLGMAEAGFFPGVIYYLSLWFPQEMRARTVSRFYVAVPISNVLMGLIAGSLLRLNGRLGLKGWQWLFLVEALPAIVMSVVVFFVLPDGPETAPWLEPEERTWLLERVGGEGLPGAKSHAGLFRALGDPRVALFGVYLFCIMACNYGFTFAAPTVFVKLTGWDAGRVGLLLAGVALLGGVSMLVMGYLSDSTGRPLAFVVPLTIVMGAGFLVSGLAQGPHVAWIVVTATTVAMAAFFGTLVLPWSLAASFLKGQPAAIGIAAINTMTIVGGFVGPYWVGWSVVRSGSYRLGWGMLAVPCAVAVVSIVTAVRRRWAKTQVAA